MIAQTQPRDRGKFAGARLDLERTPTLPATLVSLILRDPRRTLACIWAIPDDPRSAVYAAVLDLESSIPDTIRIVAMGAQPTSARFARHRLGHGAQRIIWLCPCGHRTRYLFSGLHPDRPGLRIGCKQCLGLLHQVQGGSRVRKVLIRRLAGIPDEEPIPRGLLVPTVITSDPRELRCFKNLRVSEAPVGAVSGVIDRVNGRRPETKPKAPISLPHGPMCMCLMCRSARAGGARAETDPTTPAPAPQPSAPRDSRRSRNKALPPEPRDKALPSEPRRRRGRPPLSTEHKRETTRQRVSRWRTKKKADTTANDSEAGH